MTTQFELFEHFGIKQNSKILKGATYNKVHEILSGVIDDHGWVAFAGPIGSGKTVTVFNVLHQIEKEKKVDYIEIKSPNRKGINETHLMNSIILTLGEKFLGSTAMARSMEARTLQVERLIAKAKSRDYTLCLVIDEAQELQPNTFNIIKRFRDVKLLNTGNTLAVVLLGQPALAGKLQANEEVSLRCKPYEFEYTAAEKVQIAMHYAHGLLDENQARVVAQKALNGRGQVTPLSIKRAIEDAMEKAYRVEQTTLDLSHFDFKNEAKAPVRTHRKKIEVKADAAKDVEAKISKVSGAAS